MSPQARLELAGREEGRIHDASDVREPRVARHDPRTDRTPATGCSGTISIDTWSDVNGEWVERPNSPRTVILWENCDRDAILKDFYTTMDRPVLAR
jgi:hypothetical protein